MSSKVVSLKSEHECEDETVEEGSRAPEEAWALLVHATLVPISPNSQVTTKATSLYINPDSNPMFQIQLTKQVSIPRLYHRKHTQQRSELQKASSSSIPLSLLNYIRIRSKLSEISISLSLSSNARFIAFVLLGWLRLRTMSIAESK